MGVSYSSSEIINASGYLPSFNVVQDTLAGQETTCDVSHPTGHDMYSYIALYVIV